MASCCYKYQAGTVLITVTLHWDPASTCQGLFCILHQSSCLSSSINQTLLYLHCPVLGQLRLLLQFLLQVAVGLCLFGPNCCGSEATVVACRVTFVQDRTLLRIHSHHDHTWDQMRREDEEYDKEEGRNEKGASSQGICRVFTGCEVIL